MNTLAPQYVNLFQQSRDWGRRVLRARDALQIVLAVCVGLLVLGTLSSVTLRTGEIVVSRVESEHRERQSGLVAAGAIYSSQAEYQQLQERVESMRALVARQEVVLERMPPLSRDEQSAFSDRLAAISRARVAGVWLTQLEIDRSPERLRLAGVAMSADLLPQYLQELRFEPAFGLKRLTNLAVDRSVQDERALQAGAVGFVLLQQDAAQGRGS